MTKDRERGRGRFKSAQEAAQMDGRKNLVYDGSPGSRSKGRWEWDSRAGGWVFGWPEKTKPGRRQRRKVIKPVTIGELLSLPPMRIKAADEG